MLSSQEKTVAALVSGIFPDSVAFDFRAPLRYSSDSHIHVLVVGSGPWAEAWVKMAALVCHYPNYERRRDLRTRITWVGVSREEAEEFVYEHRELFDNCRWRSVELRDSGLNIDMHRPMYEGRRKDFVDVEIEFVLGRFTAPLFQQKLAKWETDTDRQLTVVFCGPDEMQNLRYATHTAERHPAGAPPVQILALGQGAPVEERGGFRVFGDTSEAERRFSKMLGMAKYLNYFYNASYELKHVPTELPSEDVEEAWKRVTSPQIQLSNVFNIMTMATKMRTLGHSRDDWQTFYALTASEIEEMTPTEHNRWSVERLMQGSRPCTDGERAEIEKDISLKKKYKNERNAHYDLVAFDELGVDETGQNVARYDSDLIAAIPLIVKSFTDADNEG